MRTLFLFALILISQDIFAAPTVGDWAEYIGKKSSRSFWQRVELTAFDSTSDRFKMVTTVRERRAAPMIHEAWVTRRILYDGVLDSILSDFFYYW
jgi:hypothetical protein